MKNDNKGFSLIELIVVIAIMAILVGALAPQYMKFVERSRKSTDVQNVAAIKSAIEIYAADPMVAAANALETPGSVTITTSSESVTATNATGKSNLALTTAGITNIALKSSKWPASGAGISSYTLSYTISPNGTITFSETTLDTGYSILNGQYQ